MTKVWSLIGEALRVAWSQPATTIVTLLLTGAVAGVILGTTGQTVQAEQQVLARIDDAGTRSIIITDTEGRAGLTPAAIGRIGALSGVEWVVGFGPATDSRNAALGRAGRPAAVRTLYGGLPDVVVSDPWDQRPGTALVGVDAKTTLGLRLPVGGLTITDDTQLGVVGAFTASEPLIFLNRSLLAAPDPAHPYPVVRSIHILTLRPDDVSTVTDAALTVLGAEDLTSIGVQTSEAFADVRAAVAGELGRYGRQLVTIILAVGLLLVGLNLYGAVTTRRRDFGRRRALGATRPTIINLIAIQTAVLSLVGAALGAAVATTLVWQWTDLPPDWTFTAAIITLTTLAGTAAALPPAVIAAYRDPLTVLRVP